MTIAIAFGQCSFRFFATSRMMGRLMPIKSSRDWPGFLGTPAVMMTTSAPATSLQLEVPVILQS